MSAAHQIIGQLERPWSEPALSDCLEAIAEAYGFSHVAVVTIPSSDDAGEEMKPVIANWSEEFRHAFERAGLTRFSPVLRALKADPLPLVWDIETLYGFDPDEPDEAGPQVRLLIAAGCRAGAYFPVHGLTTFNGALFLAGDRAPPHEGEVKELHLAAFAVFGILAASRFEENRRRNPLSQRERDCLKLAMLGKTSSEIGTILSLSEYTVSQYLASATKKVNASNRTHAVALAAQLGYLS
jgi:LuxR family transcriptional regulator, quorum-sensing system regulator BjaR1